MTGPTEMREGRRHLRLGRARDGAPGLAITHAIADASWAIACGEERLLGHAVLEGPVAAILLGIAMRTR